MNWCSDAQSCATLCDPWAVACQAPLSMEFSRQEYWCGVPFSTPVALPQPATEPTSLMSPALAGGFFNISTTWEALNKLEGSSYLSTEDVPKEGTTGA